MSVFDSVFSDSVFNGILNGVFLLREANNSILSEIDLYFQTGCSSIFCPGSGTLVNNKTEILKAGYGKPVANMFPEDSAC